MHLYVPTEQKPVANILVFYYINNETPSLPSGSFPAIQFNPVVFWKGGYIRCYCMILQNLSSQPLKQGRADRSSAIPAVSPTLGKTRVSPHHQDSSLPLIAIHILAAPSCNWNKFMSAQQISRALLRCTHGYKPAKADLRVFVLVEAFENKQEDRGA